MQMPIAEQEFNLIDKINFINKRLRFEMGWMMKIIHFNIHGEILQKGVMLTLLNDFMLVQKLYQLYVQNALEKITEYADIALSLLILHYKLYKNPSQCNDLINAVNMIPRSKPIVVNQQTLKLALLFIDIDMQIETGIDKVDFDLLISKINLEKHFDYIESEIDSDQDIDIDFTHTHTKVKVQIKRSKARGDPSSVKKIVRDYKDSIASLITIEKKHKNHQVHISRIRPKERAFKKSDFNFDSDLE
jgi:hypothetical protein